MKILQQHAGKRLIIIQMFVLTALTVLPVACRVTMVAPYEEKVAQHIQQVAKKIDRLYLTMLEIASGSTADREYILFAEDYIDIEVELNSLLVQNRLRPLNKEATRNSEIALETWIKYKEKHKNDNFLSDVDIDLNRDFFRDLFMVLLLGEQVRKNSNN